MGSTGRDGDNGVNLPQLKTDAADATNTDRTLTIDLHNQERPLMPQSITSPESSHPQLRVIRDETRATYDAGSPTLEPGSFTITPRDVRELARDKRDATITQVYATLASYADEKGVCWPSRETIATESGVSVRKVQSVLRTLCEAGLLTIERGRHTNLYTLQRTRTYTTQSAPRAGLLDNTENVRVHDMPVTVHDVPVRVHEMHPQSAPRAHRTISNELEENVSPIGETPPKKSKPKAEPKSDPKPNPVYDLWRHWANHVGIPATARMSGKDSGGAKSLVNQGITPEQAIELYEWLISDPYWAPKGVDLPIMAGNATRWRSALTAPAVKKLLPRNDPQSGRKVF